MVKPLLAISTSFKLNDLLLVARAMLNPNATKKITILTVTERIFVREIVASSSFSFVDVTNVAICSRLF